MAMAKPAASPKPAPSSTQPRRRYLRGAVLVLAILVGSGAFIWPQLHGYAVTGAAYGARVACSCRFVGGRALGDCRKDFEPGMDLITLTEDTAARSVTARFPLIARQTATYRDGWGCVLEPWGN
jgi:hypothetical protein